MPGLLSIVATPIGNLSDLSPRAIQALEQADLILAEDPKHSQKLLISSKAKVIPCPAPREKERIPVVLERLQQGSRVALITDAGAPGISDPGGQIIQAVIEAGYRLEVIPGPSAMITALMGAGLITTHFAFLGFLPKKGKERQRLIAESHRMGLALVLFESPHRVQDTLVELHELLGRHRVVVARELTKQFETFHRGVLGQSLQPELVEKGEMVIVIEASAAQTAKSKQTTSMAQAIGQKALAKKMAAEQGISVKEAYRQLTLLQSEEDDCTLPLSLSDTKILS